MASLKNLNEGKRHTKPHYRIRWRNKGEKNPHPFTLPEGTSYEDAKALKREIETSVAKVGFWAPAEAPPVSLDEAIDRYIAYRSVPRRNKKAAKAATLSMYDIVLRRSFLAHVGMSATLHVLRVQVVDGWLDKLAAAGREPSTIYTYGSTLRAFWKWAASPRTGWPGHVQPADVDVSPPASRIVHAPTFEEATAMLTALVGPVRGRNRFPRAVARAGILERYTGLRRSQVEGLEYGAVLRSYTQKVPTGTVTAPALHILTGKTDEEEEMRRRIPIPESLLGFLEAWRRADGDPPDQTKIIGGSLPKEPECIRAAWKRSGVDPVIWKRRPNHTLRRGVTTFLSSEGVPEQASDWYVGHLPKGMNGKHYTAAEAGYWALVAPAIANMPPLDDSIALHPEVLGNH
jgi:integrase